MAKVVGGEAIEAVIDAADPSTAELGTVATGPSTKLEVVAAKPLFNELAVA